MNVFEFLGLEVDHRATNKVVQLVKHFDDVNKKADEGIYHKKVSFPMYAQVKKDGVFAMMVVTGRGIGVFGRTGKRLQSCERIVNEVRNSDKYPVGVYIAELCSDDCSLEVLSGIVNPNRVNELDHEQTLISGGMKMFYHDYLSLDEFIKGYSIRRYYERWIALYSRLPIDANILSLETIEDEKQLRDYAEHMIDCGHEGAVFKQDVEWLAGAKDWHMMKIVRGIHVDLECIGWEEGTGKYAGKVANLLFRYKNNLTVTAMLGKGWSHNDARNMYEQLKHIEAGGQFPNHYIGQVFHVYGLQESSKGIIRLPKVSELRHDKCKPDF